jgi:hypothetical protein
MLLYGRETQLNHAWGTFAMRWLHVAYGAVLVPIHRIGHGCHGLADGFHE